MRERESLEGGEGERERFYRVGGCLLEGIEVFNENASRSV